MTEPSAQRFSATYARGPRRVPARLRATPAARSSSHRHPLPGPAGEPLFLDEARFGAAGRAPRAVRRRRARTASRASAARASRPSCCAAVSPARLPDDVALVLRARRQSVGLRLVAARQRGQRRPQPQLPRPRGAAPGESRLRSARSGAQPRRSSRTPTSPSSSPPCSASRRSAAAEAVYRSLSGGQYRHPRGLQYGGHAPVWSNRVLRGVWARHAGAAELAVYIDLHSGLGPRGVGLVLQTAAEASIDARLAQRVVARRGARRAGAGQRRGAGQRPDRPGVQRRARAGGSRSASCSSSAPAR